jgi:hypothetical protein
MSEEGAEPFRPPQLFPLTVVARFPYQWQDDEVPAQSVKTKWKRYQYKYFIIYTQNLSKCEVFGDLIFVPTFLKKMSNSLLYCESFSKT